VSGRVPREILGAYMAEVIHGTVLDLQSPALFYVDLWWGKTRWETLTPQAERLQPMTSILRSGPSFFLVGVSVRAWTGTELEPLWCDYLPAISFLTSQPLLSGLQLYVPKTT
jgi:hypothetical protein